MQRGVRQLRTRHRGRGERQGIGWGKANRKTAEGGDGITPNTTSRLMAEDAENGKELAGTRRTEQPKKRAGEQPETAQSGRSRGRLCRKNRAGRGPGRLAVRPFPWSAPASF